MTVYVFTGPTLSAQDAKEVLDADYLPPVTKGDVYSVAQRRPVAIGIIDGYFQQIPSVWHKEILWAMAEGIHVFGSASMGALRAAELHQFGMWGVGRIFEAYRDRKLNDDDEVAVIHGPPETNYVALSEAMVNIRATLSAAAEANIISSHTREWLTNYAKELFCHKRTYDNILNLALQSTLPEDEINGFRDWLPSNKIDRKKNDALLMLEVMRDFISADPEPMEVSYILENTETWMC